MSLGTPRFLEKNFSIKGQKNDLSPDFSCGFLKKKKDTVEDFSSRIIRIKLGGLFFGVST